MNSIIDALPILLLIAMWYGGGMTVLYLYHAYKKDKDETN